MMQLSVQYYMEAPNDYRIAVDDSDAAGYLFRVWLGTAEFILEEI